MTAFSRAVRRLVVLRTCDWLWRSLRRTAVGADEFTQAATPENSHRPTQGAQTLAPGSHAARLTST